MLEEVGDLPRPAAEDRGPGFLRSTALRSMGSGSSCTRLGADPQHPKDLINFYGSKFGGQEIVDCGLVDILYIILFI